MKHSNAKRLSSGFTLIEVLVALIIIAIGVLGIAKLQGLALSNTGVSRMRSLAAIQAAGFASAMHANRAFWGSTSAATFTATTTSSSQTYTLSPTGGLSVVTTAGGCQPGATSLPAPCSTTNLANVDVYTWLQGLMAVLPNPIATVTCSTTALPVSCTVQIAWTENLVGANAQEAAAATANNTSGTNASAAQMAIQNPTYTLYVVP